MDTLQIGSSMYLDAVTPTEANDLAGATPTSDVKDSEASDSKATAPSMDAAAEDKPPCRQCADLVEVLFNATARYEKAECERDEARANARILAHAYLRGRPPPPAVVAAARAYPPAAEPKERTDPEQGNT